jgi:uncharacterized protein YndB with AHSA1/START domain
VHAECDLQPGGKWLMRLVGNCAAESSLSTVYGEFRDIEAPRLLAYTWIRENEDYPETLVRWDLEEKDGYTTVRVTHSGLVSDSLRARNSGWPLIMQLLEAYIERQN